MHGDPHSGPGIASFVVALLAAFVMMAMIVVAGVMQEQPGGFDENSPLYIAVILAFLAGAGMTLMSFALGVAGLFQPRRNKVFPIVGTIIASMEILAVIGLIVIGLMSGE